MRSTLKYSAIMFAAGCCYGFNIPLVRHLTASGLAIGEIMAFQYLIGIIGNAVIIALVSRRAVKLASCLKLCGVGVLASGVSFFYYQAINLLSSALAVTLLFQFTWMGVLVEALLAKKAPRPLTVASVAVILVGTLFATGVLEQGAASLGGLNYLGILFGSLSAAFYTAFLFASARTATELPAVNRTLFSSIGSFCIALTISPGFITATLPQHIADASTLLPAAALGIFGILLPVFLIATSAPHLPGSLATIMASSELPAGIICAMAFVGDSVSPLVATGVVIVLAGIVLSQGSELKAILLPGGRQ
jgi:drug/metabolite transporter (DMT)-like permease